MVNVEKVTVLSLLLSVIGELYGKLMDGDKWGGEKKNLCWLKDGVKRFLVQRLGYKECSSKSCPKNDLGPFGNVSCQICCYIDEGTIYYIFL